MTGIHQSIMIINRERLICRLAYSSRISWLDPTMEVNLDADTGRDDAAGTR